MTPIFLKNAIDFSKPEILFILAPEKSAGESRFLSLLWEEMFAKIFHQFFLDRFREF